MQGLCIYLVSSLLPQHKFINVKLSVTCVKKYCLVLFLNI